MENKTALQQAIEEIMKAIVSVSDGEECGYKRGALKTLNLMLINLESKLPTERQQLEDAWKDGNDAIDSDLTNIHEFSDYYATKYKTT